MVEDLPMISVKGNANESNLIEQILIIDMIGSQNEADEFSLDVVYIRLLEFSCLELGILIRIKRNSPQFLPILRLGSLDFKLNFGGYFTLV
jgi:hypothetical protein